MTENQNQLKVRDSSIELLRIVAMIMIVFHHFAVHGGFQWGTASVPLTRFWYNFIFMGGKIGVNVFVIISGYYLINNDKEFLNFKRIVKFLAQLIFYSIVIFLVGGLIGVSDLSIGSFLRNCFPVTFNEWWFASTYFVLYLLHPFLNKVLRNIDKPLYQKILLAVIFCWSIIPTFTDSFYQSNSLLWFIALYSIAGYIRLYGLNEKFTLKHYFIFWLAVSLFTYSLSMVFVILGNKWPVFSSYATDLYAQETITTLLISTSLFMIFATLKLNYRKGINKMASATFGVYLLHDHPVIRRVLWLEIFQNWQFQGNLWLIPYSIVSVAIVYIVCSAIDLLRQYFIERPFISLLNRYSGKKNNLFRKQIQSLQDSIFGK